MKASASALACSCAFIIPLAVTPPYLKAPCDPMDEDGFVHFPQGPGLGFEFEWNYIDDNLITD